MHDLLAARDDMRHFEMSSNHEKMGQLTAARNMMRADIVADDVANSAKSHEQLLPAGSRCNRPTDKPVKLL